MEWPDSEGEQIREVYARFGLAVYQAQCVERQIAILLATEYGPGPQKMTRAQYDDLLESHFRKTLGSLIKALRRVTETPDGLEAELARVLDKRNWLTHHYFWDRAGHFTTEKGRRLMIDELQEAADLFAHVDEELTEITQKWAKRHGITEEIIQKFMEELIENV